MQLSALLAVILGGLIANPQVVVAFGVGDGAAMFDAWNNVFLTTSGTDVFYKAAINESSPDGNWVAALDILAAEDAYEVTGDPDTQTLVNNLLTTWLANNEPPWTYVNYNDDIGWYTTALIRAYQITGNPTFLNEAIYGFEFAFSRGWDTQYNGGGIWESQPDSGGTDKEALSNDSLGRVACFLYQSTHNQTYLNQCQQIYSWVWNNIYDSSTGEVYFGVTESGTLETTPTAYNQGTFLDYANTLYRITGNMDYYNDAQQVINYGRNNLTVNGIFSNSANNINTWADDMARGVAHFVGDNRLWDTYYSWMVQNANAILTNRRPDLNITWNAWDTPTPIDNNETSRFVSAVAWLLLTPATQPDARGGIHVIVNQQTGMAIDSAGTYGNGNDVIQWAENGGQNQRWQLTQNSDTSWNIINLATWQALDCPESSTEQGITMDQWQPNRYSNQRWWVDEQSDGSYKIWNQASTLSLDGAANSTDGAPLIQSDWNGSSQQRWLLQ